MKAFFLSLLLMPVAAFAQTLAATDGLGRVLPQQEEVGVLKANKHIALFYFLWQGDSPTSEKYWDLTEMWQRDSSVFNDFDHPGWGGGAGVAGKYYFWGQPIYGYYHGGDYWVHLKNVQLLTDAGVDILILDATNRLTYLKQTDVLMRALEAVHKQGRKTPKVVFYTNTKSGETMQELYDSCYKEGAPYRYPDNWFYLDGKPLIIGISKEAGNSFFTIRESQWPNEALKVNSWPWIEFQRPQHVYLNNKGEREIVNVSTAQHPVVPMGHSAFYGQSGNWGRSYRNGVEGSSKDLPWGYNIQEQWEFALKQDVPFIFITGWNEWIAGKWRYKKSKDTAVFVDQASAEYSRDIEPSLTAGLEDHYYMQMVSNIRRYKGVDTVSLAYKDYTGDVQHRHYPGAQSSPKVIYENNTGRNDFDLMKVTRDKQYVFFYASTVAPITPNTSNNWMTLWLDIDRSAKSGWCGYDYRVVGGNELQQYKNGMWKKVAKVTYKLEGKELTISVPVKFMGNRDFEFKWSDNMQEENPLDWYVNGDAAPGGRFNFVFKIKKEI
ncbi:hypothetical protein GFS24_13280 [Chitinophaga sp. SYP-B3965]|uniref:hypothetical protein n=1 Tax=Chitinophaga sp. SYP-B3965 TaxID=2663120 RepID=UPI0012998CE2|nr:hypothetical protein [Chitinophaga sp. SYP-B3965]MRG46095.1 hypothetical protein [Chitinophaga sp. SYP-B3965]